MIRARAMVMAAVGLTVALTHPAQASAQEANAPEVAPDEGVDLTGDAPPPPEPEPEEVSWLNAPPKRRSGFTVGILGGALLGNAVGFPNDALKIDRDEFRTDTGFSGGGYGHLYIGVTFTDWIGFGVGGGFGGMRSADHMTRQFGIDFRIDAWPFFGLGGAGEDIGFNVTAGLGGANTKLREGDDDDVIDGGLASHVGLGLFWEGIHFWKINMGPFASFDAYFSQSVLQPAAWIGWRTALYVGP